MVMADPFCLGNLALPRVFAKARHAVVSETLVIVPESNGQSEVMAPGWRIALDNALVLIDS